MGHRPDTADANRRAVASGFRRSLVDVDAGHRIEGLRSVSHGLVLDLLDAPHGNRTRQVDLLLDAVSDHHDIVNTGCVLFERDFQRGAAADFDLGGLVADVRHIQAGPGQHLQSKFAFRVGHRSAVRTGDEHRSTDDRIAGLRFDTPGQLIGFVTDGFGLVEHDMPTFDLGAEALFGKSPVKEFQYILLAGLDRDPPIQIDFMLAVPERVAAFCLDRVDHLPHGGVLKRQRDNGILRIKSLRHQGEPTECQ